MPRTAHRVSLIERVAAILDRADARYALVGAAAMTVHGVGRSTRDVDLLTLSSVWLDASWWKPLCDAGVTVSVSRGDAEDPLAGVVRFDQEGERPVDLVVGRHRWQRRILDRAAPAVLRWRAPAYCSGAGPRAAQAVRGRRPGRLGLGAVAGRSGSRHARRRSHGRPRRPAGPVPGALAPDSPRPDCLRTPGSAECDAGGMLRVSDASPIRSE